MKFIKYFLFVVSLFLLVGVCSKSEPKSIETSKKYIKGVDISHYQGNIDWKNIDTAKIKFVIIKSTEGSNVKDSKFKFNWVESHKTNLLIGAYHRFSLKSSGKTQAENYINVVPKLSNSIPPIIDIENINTSKIKDKTNILKELKVLENALYVYYGKKPIFYLNEYNYYDYISKNFNNNIWLYSHGTTPPKTLETKKCIWQYSTVGKCQGIKGYVDMNYFNGDLSEFRKFIK